MTSRLPINPPPGGLDWTDAEATRRAVATLPLRVFLFVLLAWATGSFAPLEPPLPGGSTAPSAPEP